MVKIPNQKSANSKLSNNLLDTEALPSPPLSVIMMIFLKKLEPFDHSIIR